MPTLFLRCLVAAFLVYANATYASQAWKGYRWARTTSTFTLQLGDNLSNTSWKSSLTKTSKDWNSGSSPIWTVIVAGQAGDQCKMIIGTTQLCNNNYGDNGWLGLASISVIGGEYITQGSVKLNDTYFNTPLYKNDNAKQHVICQEVAHTFGLDAQSTDGKSLYTCMDYFSNTGENATNTQSTKPNAQDFEQLGNIYQYIDSFTTVAENTALDALSSNNVTDKSNTWGQLAEQSNDGRSSVYKKENVDGSITMTHVFWTIDAAQNDCTGCDHRNRYK